MKLIFQLTPQFYNQSKHQAGSAPRELPPCQSVPCHLLLRWPCEGNVLGGDAPRHQPKLGCSLSLSGHVQDLNLNQSWEQGEEFWSWNPEKRLTEGYGFGVFTHSEGGHCH